MPSLLANGVKPAKVNSGAGPINRSTSWPIGRALELACAEGHFTIQLAPRVQQLLATDNSPRLRPAPRRAAPRRAISAIRFWICRREPSSAERIVILCSEALLPLQRGRIVADCSDYRLSSQARRLFGDSACLCAKGQSGLYLLRLGHDLRCRGDSSRFRGPRWSRRSKLKSIESTASAELPRMRRYARVASRNCRWWTSSTVKSRVSWCGAAQKYNLPRQTAASIVRMLVLMYHGVFNSVLG